MKPNFFMIYQLDSDIQSLGVEALEALGFDSEEDLTAALEPLMKARDQQDLIAA